jgi:medium-chain acyl-[acyl-carrier-protein] hydrolase
VYRAWPDHLDERIEVRSVVLPGRERRYVEPALSSVDALADLFVPALRAALDPPFAIFGHSLGAMLGFETARRLAAAGQAPVRLVASGARAPHVPTSGSSYHRMSDAQFLAGVRDLGGTPPELTANDEFLELMLPTLRADFTAAETYRWPPGHPLPCPITAFGGADDTLVPRADLEAWSAHTSRGLTLHMLPGDHFFIGSAQARLLELLDRELAGHLDPSRP